MLKTIESPTTTNVDVRVIGVGGAGCSSLNRLSENVSESVNMLGIDSGSATQNLSSNIETLVIGSGFGSGGNPESAGELFSDIELAVADFIGEADVVIILAGLGRGTGSALSPRVAALARAFGTLTIAAVNMPFEFEGRFRNQSAVQAHQELSASVDAIVTMNNDDLSKLSSAGASLNGAFQEADQNISDAVHAITNALESSVGRKTALQESLTNAGESLVLSALSNGLHAGSSAVADAFRTINGEQGHVNSAVIHVEGGIGLSLGQVAEAVAETRKRIGRRAAIHVSSERSIERGQDIKVTLILAGVENTERVSEIGDSILHPESGDRIPSVSIFDTPEPRRTRGPVLLPTG
jgi:cell division protein FtsZ